MSLPDAEISPESGTDFEPVIGLEIHVQLATGAKLFDVCDYRPNAAPNTLLGPVSYGLPGAMPVLDRDAVRLAVRAALALECEIERSSSWDRKHYFYPDLPKGYQITQYDRPFARGGKLVFESEDGGRLELALSRIHLEEDAGKSIHVEGADGEPGYTLVDFNRSGAPLLEIVTAPQLASPADAERALRRLRSTLVAAGVSGCEMELGTLRCDANVSLSRSRTPGARVEIKNLNSFRFVRRALEREIERQRHLLTDGHEVQRETRGYDESDDRTFAMRGKEGEPDYRYLPEPDLPDLLIDEALLEDARRELPAARHQVFREFAEAGLGVTEAGRLADEPGLADLAVATSGVNSQISMTTAAQWVLNEKLAPGCTAERLAQMIVAVESRVVSRTHARELLASECEGRPLEIARERGWLLDEVASETLTKWCEQALAAEPDLADRCRDDKPQLLGYFVAKVKQAAGQEVDARAVSQILRELLGHENR